MQPVIECGLRVNYARNLYKTFFPFFILDQFHFHLKVNFKSNTFLFDQTNKQHLIVFFCFFFSFPFFFLSILLFSLNFKANDDLINQNNSNSSSSNQQTQNSTILPVKLEPGRTFSGDIEFTIIETIKENMNKRSIGESKNFLKLLLATCGISEIRLLALNKIESWMSNPKVNSKRIYFATKLYFHQQVY